MSKILGIIVVINCFIILSETIDNSGCSLNFITQTIYPLEKKSKFSFHTRNLSLNRYKTSETPDDPSSPSPILPRPKNHQNCLPKVEDGRLDIYSRLMKDRKLFIGSQINDELANSLVAQMIYLASINPEKSIKLYINSPGGSVTAGMAIFDMINHIPCDVETICLGSASSMAAFLLAAGTTGKRKSFPNCRIMIHQPLGGAHGQAADIEIQAKEILFTKQLLNTYLSHYTGQPISKIEEDTDRNFFMTASEALSYGIIDEVIQTKISHVHVDAMPSLI